GGAQDLTRGLVHWKLLSRQRLHTLWAAAFLCCVHEIGIQVPPAEFSRCDPFENRPMLALSGRFCARRRRVPEDSPLCLHPPGSRQAALHLPADGSWLVRPLGEALGVTSPMQTGPSTRYRKAQTEAFGLQRKNERQLRIAAGVARDQR